MKTTAVLVLSVALTGCFFNRPEVVDSSEPAVSRSDLSRGFRPIEDTPAPLGPLEADRTYYGVIQQIDEQDAWNNPDAAGELAAQSREASQVMLAASSAELFRKGVHAGSPGLIKLACRASRRVTEPGLRRSGRLNDVDGACAGLGTRPEDAATRQCGDAVSGLLGAYRLLASGQEAEARRAAAEALRALSGCKEARPFKRTPVGPATRGFMIVALLQLLGAEPFLCMQGEQAPSNAVEVINARFVEMAGVVGSTIGKGSDEDESY